MADRSPPDPQFQRTQFMPRRDMGSELPVGHRLQEYVVEGLIGVGGFSIVYRVRDTRLDRLVAIKEYIPASLALRAPNGDVQPRTPRHQEHFNLGMRSFVNEARLLASFDHPALVKVYRAWAESGTAYMVMPLYEGMTLAKWLAHLGTPPSEAWLRHLAHQLIEALAALHTQRIFHRDVAPDNILLQVDKAAGNYLQQKPQPVLLDFGAARRVISDATQNLTAILKSGYSPPEQYQGAESPRQGAWTDVYALSAVLYAAIVGRAPPSSISRIVNDTMVPAVVAGAGRYSHGLLAAIDAGLAVMPQDRPQSMAAFRSLLDAVAVAPVAAPPAPAAVARPTPAALAMRRCLGIGAAVLAAAALGALARWRLK